MPLEDLDPDVSGAANGITAGNSPTPAAGHERRSSPRATLLNLAYVHLEPDSGAIVLNVSPGGLCFYAVGPVHQTGAIRVRLSLKRKQRVEAQCELVWTDATKKMGGLKFISLPSEALEQIRRWTAQPEIVVSADATDAMPLGDPVPAALPLTDATADLNGLLAQALISVQELCGAEERHDVTSREVAPSIERAERIDTMAISPSGRSTLHRSTITGQGTADDPPLADRALPLSCRSKRYRPDPALRIRRALVPLNTSIRVQNLQTDSSRDVRSRWCLVPP